MQTVTIELMNEDAMALIQQLERLNILRLIKPIQLEQPPKKQNKWAGSISKSTAQNMLLQLDQSRNEWERNI